MWWQKKWVIGALAAMATVFIFPDLLRVYEDYPTLGFEADNDGRIINVSNGVKSRLAGCGYIDISQTPFEDRMAIFGGLGGRQYVRPSLDKPIQFVCKHDNTQALDWREVAPQKPSNSPLLGRVVLLIQELIGLSFIYVATMAVWQRPSLATFGFFLYAIWFNPGQNYVLYAEAQRLPLLAVGLEAVQVALQTLGYWGLMIFALAFPTAPRHRWQRQARRVIDLIAVVLGILQLCSFATAIGFRTELITRLSLYAGYFIVIAVIVIVGLRYLWLTSEDRQRMLWVFVGCVIGLPAYIFADLASSTSALGTSSNFSNEVLSLLYIPNAFLLYAVVTAIRRDRLVRVTFALGRRAVLSLVWVLVFLIVAVSATLLEHQIESSLFGKDHKPLERAEIVLTVIRFGFYYGVVALLKFLVDISVEHVTHGVDRIFFRRHHDAQQRLRTAVTALEDAVDDFHEIEHHLVCDPVKWLSLTWSALFVRRNGGFELALSCPRLYPFDPSGPPGPSQKLVGILERNCSRSAIRLTERDDLTDKEVSARESPSLAVPIFARDNLVAIAFYGEHSGGDDIDHVEMATLGELGHAAGLAWRRAQMLKDTLDKNKILEGEVEDLTHQIENMKGQMRP